MPSFQGGGKEEVDEAWRYRRTAYRSGRLELVGFEGNPYKRKTRKVKREFQSATKYTPFRGQFRWRRY